MDVWIWIVCIILVTILSSFFSTNTIALRTFSHVKLAESLKRRNKEEKIDAITEKKESVLLSCSLFRLICNMIVMFLLLGMFAARQESKLQLIDFLAAFGISILLLSVFILAVPHALAKYAGEEILSVTYRILFGFSYLAAPALYVFRLYDMLVKRLAGVPEATTEEMQEEKHEEFLTGLEQQRMEGVVDEEEQEMIESVLELSDTTADEIMTPRTEVVALDVNSGLSEILKIIIEAGHSRLPVYEENIDNIIGFIYAKDLLTEVGKETNGFELRSKLREAYFVPETKSLRTLLHEFQNQKLHIAVVLDEYGGTAGIVTIEDILEELVGEITDEYESTPPKFIKVINEKTIDVDARTPIDDLNDRFDLDLPEDEDYETIGGFVFSYLGYIPKATETFMYENLKFTITGAEKRKVKKLRIEKMIEQTNAGQR